MSRRAQVEFVHERERYRAEVAYDRTRHTVGICGECGRADQAVRVSVQVVRIWHGDAAIPRDDARFPILARAAKDVFRWSDLYGEAMADAGPL